jgi:hypothetical protein
LNQPENGKGECAFAAAAFTDQCYRFALIYAKTDVMYGISAGFSG